MRPTTVPAGSDHYFNTDCLSVRPETSKSSENHCRLGCGLAELIILFIVCLPSWSKKYQSVENCLERTFVLTELASNDELATRDLMARESMLLITGRGEM